MSIFQAPKKEAGVKSVIVAGGLDPSGGAGLSADIMAVQTAGVLALPIATALTVQDSANAYSSYPVAADIIEEQLAIVVDDFRPAYLKLGLAGSAETAERLAEFVSNYGLKLVLDPVMASSGGAILVDAATKAILAECLVPRSFLVTPNCMEAETLTGQRVTSREEARQAAVKLKEMGAGNVLITGGHLSKESGTGCVDYLYNGSDFTEFSAPREGGGGIRGTGCHLASAITAYLAQGCELGVAVSKAKVYVTTMINQSVKCGQGARQASPGARQKGKE
jgi:hydroxymethylpyrimidine kinase/phosphomethylpyrimidine kinase